MRRNKGCNVLRVRGIEPVASKLDWMEEWISTTRIENNYHIDGIDVDTFYHSFVFFFILIIPLMLVYGLIERILCIQ